jgi:hypothetical protein
VLLFIGVSSDARLQLFATSKMMMMVTGFIHSLLVGRRPPHHAPWATERDRSTTSTATQQDEVAGLKSSRLVERLLDKDFSMCGQVKPVLQAQKTALLLQFDFQEFVASASGLLAKAQTWHDLIVRKSRA